MKSLYFGFASGFANAFRYFPSELQIVGSRAIVKHVGIQIVEIGHIAIQLQYVHITWYVRMCDLQYWLNDNMYGYIIHVHIHIIQSIG